MTPKQLFKSRGAGYTSPTPPLGQMLNEKQDKQHQEPFPDLSEKFPSKPKSFSETYPTKEMLSPSEKAFYAKQKLAEVAMKSFGRYHE